MDEMGTKTFMVFLANKNQHTFEHEDFVLIDDKSPVPNLPGGPPMLFMAGKDAPPKINETEDSSERFHETTVNVQSRQFTVLLHGIAALDPCPGARSAWR
ncbi:hypothetical protein [Glutamicibacter sp. 0426]|uniref:hypothetical protein n=1 Tax=Glutamicibacter sp. 0426 TaxID=1913445 RepID=UPI0011611942|nr:hypothetical protein [Glutamicibacter sp. 0426]